MWRGYVVRTPGGVVVVVVVVVTSRLSSDVVLVALDSCLSSKQ